MPKGIRKLYISVGEYNLTHFGGILLIHAFCKNLRLKWLLQKKVFFHQRSSPYHPTELILAILYAIIVGIYRLSKTKILQGNSSFQRIIGLKSFPYASSLRRCLKRVNSKTIRGINKVHDQLRLKMFHFQPHTSLLFDLDSSVLTLYGKFIEEAKVGYNPHKRGRRSYHPLFCFESHTKDFWHGVLRPGDAYTAAGAVEFWKECLVKIPSYIYRISLRGDSGFFDHKFIEPLDEEKVGYAVVAKITPAIKRQLEGLRYYRFKKDWGAAEFYYKPWKWKNPHRFVVIRRPLPEKDAEQLTLFTLTRYAYQVFVTNLPIKPIKHLVLLQRPSHYRANYQRTQGRLHVSQDSHKQLSGQSNLFLSTPFCLQHNQLVQENLFIPKIPECYFANYSHRVSCFACEINKIWKQECAQGASRIYLETNIRADYAQN